MAKYSQCEWATYSFYRTTKMLFSCVHRLIVLEGINYTGEKFNGKLKGSVKVNHMGRLWKLQLQKEMHKNSQVVKKLRP